MSNIRASWRYYSNLKHIKGHPQPLNLLTSPLDLELKGLMKPIELVTSPVEVDDDCHMHHL